MGFLDDIKKDDSFSDKADESVLRAARNLRYTTSSMLRPYDDLTSSIKAIGYPFFHATQFVRDVGRFVYGAMVFVGALATLNFSNAGNVASSMDKLVGAVNIELLNISLAVVSLVTRSIASIFILGYVSTIGLKYADAIERMNAMDTIGDEERNDAAFNLV